MYWKLEFEACVLYHTAVSVSVHAKANLNQYKNFYDHGTISWSNINDSYSCPQQGVVVGFSKIMSQSFSCTQSDFSTSWRLCFFFFCNAISESLSCILKSVRLTEQFLSYKVSDLPFATPIRALKAFVLTGTHRHENLDPMRK